MPLGPATKAFFEKIASQPPAKTIPEMTIDELRDANIAAFNQFCGPLPDGATPDDFKKSSVVLSDDTSIPLVTFTPLNYDRETSGCILFFYGGGFAMPMLQSHYPAIATLANSCGAKVIAIDYLTTPEYSIQTVRDSAYESVKVIFSHADEYDINRMNVSIFGYSSGGNLAASIVNRSCESGDFQFTKQILLNPWLDLSFTINNPIFSVFEQDDKMLTGKIIRDLAKTFCLRESDNPLSPEISPFFAQTPVNLPHTTIITSEFDTFRGTTEEFFKKLKASGCANVEKVVLSGQTHNCLIARAVIGDGDNPAELAGKIIAETKTLLPSHS